MSGVSMSSGSSTKSRKRGNGGKVAGLVANIRFAVVTAVVVFVAGCGWYFGMRAAGFTSDLDAAKHLASATGCETAEFLGIAPSNKGEPGYWRHLDADTDMIACETIVVDGVKIRAR